MQRPGDDRDYYSILRFVSINDVILLEKGQPVYCDKIPAYFREHVNPYSTGFTRGLVRIGVPKSRPVTSQFLRDRVAKTITAIFLYYSLPLDKDIMSRFLAHQIKELADDKFLVPPGLYKVCEITLERNGRQVYCRTYQPDASRPEMEISFFLDSYDPANHSVVKIVKGIDK